MSENVLLIDDFGRETIFSGSLLVDDTTDLAHRAKPQWAEITVWKTEGGQYVVRRMTRYRVLHSNEKCPRASGGDHRPASDHDTFPCSRCVGKMTTTGYFGIEDKMSVEVYPTPIELVKGLGSSNGTNVTENYSAFVQALLADLSELDDDIHAVWMKRVVS